VDVVVCPGCRQRDIRLAQVSDNTIAQLMAELGLVARIRRRRQVSRRDAATQTD